MKKVVAVMLSLMLMLPCFLPAAAEAKKISVITTIFPLYDWAREVVGQDSGNVELAMLLANGVDLHSYQPTVQDIVRISTCDVFIGQMGEQRPGRSSQQGHEGHQSAGSHGGRPQDGGDRGRHGARS